mgnify:CR=1 FL=1|tara:strand:- start:336 stop:1208 length:873 start_codon:yes stop_codon:yes gene_type:complete
MAMIVDWEYFFPDVYFKHNRFETWSKEDLKCVVDKDGNWDPQKDFEFHLDKLKVESKYFDEKNKDLFPKDFRRPLYSIKKFEEARIELLNRVQLTFVEQKEKENYNEELDDYEYEGYSTFKIEILEADKNVEVDKGTIGQAKSRYENGEVIYFGEDEFRVWGKKNVISSHRFNAINILYDWLLSLSPRGSYNNNWQIFAYGVSEYDETLSYVDNFIIDVEDNQASIPGIEKENRNKIINQSLKTNFRDFNTEKKTESSLASDLFAEKLSLQVSTAKDIRDLLKEWNPFIK